MSKLRRVVNDLLSINPTKINSARSVHQQFNHDGHDVSVFHMQDRPEDPHSYSTHFQVDGEFSKGKKTGSGQGFQILAKVHDHVNQFIKDKKPSEMRFKANSPTKHKIYGAIANRVAAKHGGEVISTSTEHTIKFKRPTIMQRFRQRMNETELQKAYDNQPDDIGDMKHEFNVGQHSVKMLYTQMEMRDKKSYAADFYVNGDSNRRAGMKKGDGVKILARVHSHLHDFIDKVRPTKLEFEANSRAKHKIYGMMAGRLAKKHGGNVVSDKHSHVVHFPQNKA